MERVAQGYGLHYPMSVLSNMRVRPRLRQTHPTPPGCFGRRQLFACLSYGECGGRGAKTKQFGWIDAACLAGFHNTANTYSQRSRIFQTTLNTRCLRKSSDNSDYIVSKLFQLAIASLGSLATEHIIQYAFSWANASSFGLISGHHSPATCPAGGNSEDPPLCFRPAGAAELSQGALPALHDLHEYLHTFAPPSV